MFKLKETRTFYQTTNFGSEETKYTLRMTGESFVPARTVLDTIKYYATDINLCVIKYLFNLIQRGEQRAL